MFINHYPEMPMAGGVELDGNKGPFQPKAFQDSLPAAEALTVLPHQDHSQPCAEQTPRHQTQRSSLPTKWRTPNPQQTPPAPCQGCRGAPGSPGSPCSSTHLPLSAEMYSSQEMVLGDGGVSDCRRTGCGTSTAQLRALPSLPPAASPTCSCPQPQAQPQPALLRPAPALSPHGHLL